MTDIFEVQDDITAAILAGLNIHVSTNPERRRPTDVVEAYALFLKARAAINMQDSGAEAALSDLLRAIDLDPDFAEAHELLAHLYWTQYIPGIERTETKELMRRSAAAALATDPDLVLARVLILLGSADKYTSPELVEALSNAARERPNDPAILRTLTWELLIAGYLDQALRVAERYIDIDPLSPIAHIRYAAILYAVGRTGESVAEFKAAAAIATDNLDWYLGELFLGEKRDQKAIEYLEAYLEQSGDADPAWVEDLVARGRDPAFGSAYLDERIPVIVQSVPPELRTDLHENLNRFYLFFGYLDRYFDIVLAEFPDDSAWTGVTMYVMYGTVNRNLGFTAHPDYLKLAKLLGLTDVWEQLGPPDFCRKAGGQWVCQ
jgi:tetratricopeptide (TPR) repeat protein